MLKKTITYTSLFTDLPVSEDHYFHISKADLIEMEMEEHKAEYTDKGGKKLTGMQAKLQKIVDSEDGKAIMDELKDIVRRSYGQKDGDRFRKSKEISDDFLASEAYSQFLFEICTNSTAAAEFINGVIPKNLEQIAAEVQAQVAAEQAKTEGATAASALKRAEEPLESAAADPTGLSSPKMTPRALTSREVADMDAHELQSGLADGRYKLS